MAGRAAVVSDCTEDAFVTAVAGGGEVTFEDDCTITLSAPVPINADTTIDASGFNVTISGGGQVRLFNVTGGVLTLRGLKLINGKNVTGGALYIQKNAVVTAEDCTFQGNNATGTNGVAGAAGRDEENGAGGNGGSGSPGMPALGGAIYNLGTLTLTTCIFSTNSAAGGDGGAGGKGGNSAGPLGQGGNGGSGADGAPAQGGAIFNGGDLSLSECSFTGNSAVAGDGGAGGAGGSAAFSGRPGNGGAGNAGQGGAIHNLGSSLSIEKCEFSGNSSRGGNSSKAGTDSDGEGNRGPNGGYAGGGAVCNGGRGTITNCTFYNNSVRGGNGGNGGDGVGTFPTAGKGGDGGSGIGGAVQTWTNLYVSFSTLVNCAAYGGTNGVAGSGHFGGGNGAPGSARGGNIAGGTGEKCVLFASIIGSPANGGCGSGVFRDAGYTLSSDNSILPAGVGSLVNVTNLLLGSFANHGGPTRTISLQTNSPAIDRVPMGAWVPDTDQRGVHRPLEGGEPGSEDADSGAFESEIGSPPIILQQPVSRTNIQGSAVTFSVTAVGAAPLRYQWRYQYEPIAGATGSSFALTNVNSANQGPYDVVITNNHGAPQTSSEVWVYLSPSLTNQLTDVVVSLGSNATFTARAVGDPVLEYQWFFNGTNLPGQTSSSFTTNGVPEAIGVYSVTITNNFGSASGSARLNMRPGITNQPVSLSVPPNSSVVFSVSAVGSAPLRYRWRFNGNNIISPQATFDSYTNSSVQRTNAGPYDVVVANSFGAVTSLVANLTVLDAIGWVREGTIGVPDTVLRVQMGGTNAVVRTDSEGRFAFALPDGPYVVEPALANYVFEPTFVEGRYPPGDHNIQFSAIPLIQIAATTNGMRLTAGGIPGLTYFILASTNAAGTNSSEWQPLSTNTAPILFIDPAATNLQQRSYRLKR